MTVTEDSIRLQIAQLVLDREATRRQLYDCDDLDSDQFEDLRAKQHNLTGRLWGLLFAIGVNADEYPYCDDLGGTLDDPYWWGETNSPYEPISPLLAPPTPSNLLSFKP